HRALAGSGPWRAHAAEDVRRLAGGAQGAVRVRDRCGGRDGAAAQPGNAEAPRSTWGPLPPDPSSGGIAVLPNDSHLIYKVCAGAEWEQAASVSMGSAARSDSSKGMPVRDPTPLASASSRGQTSAVDARIAGQLLVVAVLGCSARAPSPP